MPFVLLAVKSYNKVYIDHIVPLDGGELIWKKVR